MPTHPLVSCDRTNQSRTLTRKLGHSFFVCYGCSSVTHGCCKCSLKALCDCGGEAQNPTEEVHGPLSQNSKIYQSRSETPLRSLKDSTRLEVIQNRRGPPTKPRTRLRTREVEPRSRTPTSSFEHVPNQLSRRMQSADRGFHPLHLRPDCDEECEVVV